MIAIINKRLAGSLFHYAHFLIDCLYTEIINDVYKYKKVFRIKNIDQTLGNLSKIYEEVMQNKNIEIYQEEFNILDIKPTILDIKENYTDILYINKFRNFIFNRYNINPLIYIEGYPEVILIKRGERIQLIDDITLQKINTNITTGKERREISNIEEVEYYLQKKYSDKFKSMYMEFIPFEEQVKIFNNAKLIVIAHGAAISSILFCKEKTKIIEVSCGVNYEWFDICFNNLKIDYNKINNNSHIEVIKMLKNI